MRIIDFHTHYYPDAIAEKTVAALHARSGAVAFGDGTRKGLQKSMAEGDVEMCVVLPVATRPEQVRKINTLNAGMIQAEGLIMAAAIHPDCPDLEAELDWIKAAGFSLMKIHPDYQGRDIRDEKFLRILEGAARRDLITVTHAGVDPGFPGEPVRCTPEAVAEILEKMPGLLDEKLVLAHMGGAEMPDEVLKWLPGKPVYFDTAFVLDQYPEKCVEIIRKHGADHILFATDSPWASHRDYVKLIQKLGLSEAELEAIAHENAEKLLGLAGEQER